MQIHGMELQVARAASNQDMAKARRGGSREAIVEAATGLFLERGYGAVSMDELAEAAGVARRTLYNQFTSKEEIFREMLLRVSGQLEDAFPPGIETRGDVEQVLRQIARVIPRSAQAPGISGLPAHGGGRFPPIPLDRGGVRRRHGSAGGTAVALPRPYGLAGRPRLPRSAAGRSPVHRDSPTNSRSGPCCWGATGYPVRTEDLIEETIRMFLPSTTGARSRRGFLGKILASRCTYCLDGSGVNGPSWQIAPLSLTRIDCRLPQTSSARTT